MDVDYLVLADAAAAADGKLYIHGAGWDTIHATAFPVTHPLMAVALRLRVPWSETNQRHRLELDLVDADGQSILPQPPGPLAGEITVGRPPDIEPGIDQVIPLVLNIAGVQFGRPGTYVAVLTLDGLEGARSPFHVRAMAPRGAS